LSWHPWSLPHKALVRPTPRFSGHCTGVDPCPMTAFSGLGPQFSAPPLKGEVALLRRHGTVLTHRGAQTRGISRPQATEAPLLLPSNADLDAARKACTSETPAPPDSESEELGVRYIGGLRRRVACAGWEWDAPVPRDVPGHVDRVGVPEWTACLGERD
jgi:hypothetical protein